MTSADFDGRRILILGYGLEGASTHRWLREHARPSFVAVADRAAVELVAPADAQFSAEDALTHLQEFDVIVRSPGVPAFGAELAAARSARVHVTSQTNLLLTDWDAQTIGITGTKGKSTTSSLLAAILAADRPDVRLVGNIGVPPLDDIPTANAGTTFVAELSSYQLEDATASPRFAVLLGLRAEHLDRHGSFQAYVDAKWNVAAHQGADGVLVTDADTEANRDAARDAKGRVVWYSLVDWMADAFIADGRVRVRAAVGEVVDVLAVSEIPLLGLGNQRNVLAASAMATVLGVAPVTIAEAVRSFHALPHRIDFIGERNGIRFYDDSIATIPDAAINALEALGDAVQTLIAGGHDRGISYEAFGAWLAVHPAVENLILFPPAGERIMAALSAADAGVRRRIVQVEAMQEAVDVALANTAPGRIVLLSPAAASFGTFRDYRDRGDQFRRALGFPAAVGG